MYTMSDKSDKITVEDITAELAKEPEEPKEPEAQPLIVEVEQPDTKESKTFTTATGNNETIQAFMVCEGVLQEYICYITGTTQDDLFRSGVESKSFDFLDSKRKKWSLKLAVVEKDHIFPLKEFNTRLVLDAMTWITKALPIIYKLIVPTLKMDRIPDPDVLKDSVIAWDPANTTAILYSPKLAATIKEKGKRIGFVWA